MTTAKQARQTELPYREDCSVLFSHFASDAWSVWLDSGRPGSQRGRYDIIAIDPFVRIQTRGRITRIDTRDGSSESSGDPFHLLREWLNRYPVADSGLPFSGGALGYFGYDLGRRIEQMPVLATQDLSLPDMAVGLYDCALVIDHQELRCIAIEAGIEPERSAAVVAQWQQMLQQNEAAASDSFCVLEQPQSNLDRAAYGRAFQRIQSYIRAGDCYQVNLAQRFSAPVKGDPWAAYQYLRSINPAPHAAWMRLDEAAVLSSSPERFLLLEQGRVETKPIKGTRPRHQDDRADQAEIDALQQSPKDRAENVMIVDLLRNDIGKCCRIGSVNVPKLFEIESFATVHHLVSTVAGELAVGQQASDLLRACFPGGSITGAPKLRAMEIIEELEPHRRSVYCGAIGYLGFDGRMDTNIAIRTLVVSDDRMTCWAGGGIVRDSQEQAEYQESLDKAAAMLRVYAHFN